MSQTAIMDFPADAANHLTASTLRVTLYESQPFVELELTIRDKPRDNWPEADWLCLPFKVASPRFCVGRPLGTMDPAGEILRGANRHLFAVGTGVTLTDADGSRHRAVPGRSPAGESRSARLLEVLVRLCAQKADRVPQSLQQPVQHQLPLLVSGHVELARAALDVRQGCDRRRRARDPVAGGPQPAGGRGGRRAGRKTPFDAIGPAQFRGPACW